MKQALGYTKAAIVALTLMFLPLAGCQTPEAQTVSELWNEARDPEGPGGADITAEEAAAIRLAMDAYMDAIGDIDWKGTVATAGAGALALVSTRLLGFDVTQLFTPLGNRRTPIQALSGGRLGNVDTDGVPTIVRAGPAPVSTQPSVAPPASPADS